MVSYDRQILTLRDDELELFVRDWVAQKAKAKEYVEVESFTGAGDMGRDVVGFLSKARHEGPWHNYQCKQYARKLDTATGLLELGKILYYSYLGKFTPPKAYFFVAPRGVNRNLESLIFNPSECKKALLNDWDKYCADKIVENEVINLTDGLRVYIEAFDFSTVSRVTVHKMLEDPALQPVLFKWFGADPGPPPQGEVPSEVQDWESPYIRQLIDAYGEHDGCAYASHAELADHPSHGPHLKHQRERFFKADAFKRFYRDNTAPEELEGFEDDIYHGIIDTHGAEYPNSLARVNKVMEQAAVVHPAGTLAKYARVPIKQGVCHHFANGGRLKWRR